uniref:Uncharacterized protein n=1 Tax=Anopheles atroparvus TaxID=41427 RepID=A0AAG5DCK0_ANOAO
MYPLTMRELPRALAGRLRTSDRYCFRISLGRRRQYCGMRDIGRTFDQSISSVARTAHASARSANTENFILLLSPDALNCQKTETQWAAGVELVVYIAGDRPKC